VLDEKSDEVDGNARLALALLSVGTQVYAEASEQARPAHVRYFPSEASLAALRSIREFIRLR
jgi:hypothetical protein